MMFKFSSWAALKDSDEEVDVTVEVGYIFYGAAATRFDPEEDPYLEFVVKDKYDNDITALITEYSSERIADECFERGRDE